MHHNLSAWKYLNLSEDPANNIFKCVQKKEINILVYEKNKPDACGGNRNIVTLGP